MLESYLNHIDGLQPILKIQSTKICPPCWYKMQEKTVKKKKNKSLRKDNKHADDNVTHRLLLVYFSSFFLVGIEINGKRK